MAHLKDRVRARVKSALSVHPDLFIPAFRAFGPRSTQQLLISNDTDIVIEAYPRSGNTFSVVAFEQAQPRPVKIAHHLHVPAQILRGVERGLPVLVPIRDPIAAVKSFKLIYPHLDENGELARWMRFYGAVNKVLPRVVVADFRDVTTDYGAVIDRVNARFGTTFGRFDHSDADVAKVFERIEDIDRAHRGGSVEYVARPSEERRRIRDDASFAFDPARAADAQAMYAEMTSRAHLA